MKMSMRSWVGVVVAVAASFGLAGCVGTGGGSGGGGTGGTAGTAGTGGSGGGGECGGIAGKTCADSEYCDYALDDCGADDGLGECKPRPEACPDIYSPVCTCAGTVSGNDCDAYGTGQDLSIAGGCTAPDGMFGCGYGFCDKATQYCQRTTSDVVGFPDSYGCQELPAACSPGPATCDCLAAESCGAMCSEADGGFTLTCPGG